jgi:hypothetical protein
MKDEFVTDVEITRFLLGDVDDEERQRLESLFISDPESRERILIVENDLIDDYLEECLPASDRAKFVAQYGDAPQKRRKLRIARSIREYAVAEATLIQTASAVNPKWRTFLSSLAPRRPLLVIPVAVTLAIACIVAVVWLVQLNNRKSQENSRRVAIEKELKDLNAPSSFQGDSSQVFSLVLPPVSPRGVNRQPNTAPQNTNRLVELRLLWTRTEDYQSYLAVLRRVGGTEKFTIPNVYSEKTPSGSVLRLRIPAQDLPGGLYVISVSGIAADSTWGPAEEYNFILGG